MLVLKHHTAALHAHKSSAPSAQDASLAPRFGQDLSRFAQRQKPLSLKVKQAGQEHPIELPAGATAVPRD
jgi:hypothetical protein